MATAEHIPPIAQRGQPGPSSENVSCGGSVPVSPGVDVIAVVFVCEGGGGGVIVVAAVRVVDGIMAVVWPVDVPGVVDDVPASVVKENTRLQALSDSSPTALTLQ
jgi:hypothetical protein